VKYLMVSHYTPARDGVAIYAAEIVARLRREGHAVEVVSLEPSAAEHQADFRTNLGLLKVLRLSWRADRTFVNFIPEQFFRSLERRYFIFHWPVFVALLLFGHGVEMVIHEAPYADIGRSTGIKRRVLNAMWRAMVRAPRQTYVHTAWERERLGHALQMRVDSVRILDSGDPITKRTRLGRAEARKMLALDPDRYIYLCIGFLQRHKGFDRAVRALPHILGDVQLHITGSMRVPAPEIESYVQELRELVRHTPRTFLHEGFLDEATFDRWLVACDAVVLPYRDIYSSGILERAKLWERPAVVTNVGGLGSQADSNTTVVVDDDELLHAMARLAGAEVEEERGVGTSDLDESDDFDTVAELARRRASRRRGSESVAVAIPPSNELRAPDDFPHPVPPDGRDWRSRIKRFVVLAIRFQLKPIIDRINEVQAMAWDSQVRIRNLETEVNPVHDDSVYDHHQWAFRGHGQEIADRLAIYLPDLESLDRNGAPVLEIGPGRGEFLELLKCRGILAYGVDLNDRFVSAARSHGIDMRHEEGLRHLTTIQDDSVAAVAAFHVAEHLPIPTLIALLRECHRVIRPGGIIVLEVPNLTNVTVGASSFYLDPTHRRPLHPALLEFLVSIAGFTETSLAFVHPPDFARLVPTSDDDSVRRMAELMNERFLVGNDASVRGWKR
jgi:glycosyltransferase involved in cell wall biosynthesis/SAM-dependent methyltransferase